MTSGCDLRRTCRSPCGASRWPCTHAPPALRESGRRRWTAPSPGSGRCWARWSPPWLSSPGLLRCRTVRHGLCWLTMSGRTPKRQRRDRQLPGRAGSPDPSGAGRPLGPGGRRGKCWNAGSGEPADLCPGRSVDHSAARAELLVHTVGRRTDRSQGRLSRRGRDVPGRDPAHGGDGCRARFAAADQRTAVRHREVRRRRPGSRWA